MNCAASGTSHIIINEIMYDPHEDDTTHEWIELYNPTNITFNLTGWSMTDNYATDTLHPYNITNNGSMELLPQSYSIITDRDTLLYMNLTHITDILLLTVDDLSIGNGLGNTYDSIQLINDTGCTIDTVEWGIDNPSIPGIPAPLVTKGNSISRYNSTDSDDSSIDFYEAIQPTPGTENIFMQKGTITIITYPMFIPKAYKNEPYSLPFAIQIDIKNYSANTTYELKPYITGEIETTDPVGQTWNGTNWQYSDRYTINVTTDDLGSYCNWIFLRLNTGYKAYQESITQNTSVLLHVKLRKNDHIDRAQVPVHLLDMDNTTTNATPGGYLVSVALYPNHCAILRDQNGTILGIYQTEDNAINEDLCIIPGYYRITSPIGNNYCLTFYNETMQSVDIIENISIHQGRYNLELSATKTSVELHPNEQLTIPLTLFNSGDFPDNITLTMKTQGNHWRIGMDTDHFNIQQKHNQTILLHIKPPYHPQQTTTSEQITITASSDTDYNIQYTIRINCKLIGPDLTIKKIICYNEEGNETQTIGEGEYVDIKAYLKNQGSENASNIHVSFYYDSIDPDHLIEVEYYDNISTYQKYPSVRWDTHGIPSGSHTIYVVADSTNTVIETDEFNNDLEITLYVFDTRQATGDNSIVISEFYYQARPGIKNEYLCLYNPTNSSINISGWYLTTKPWNSREDQQKLYFPEHASIPAFETIIITQNATSYSWETGKQPDYEYKDNSTDLIPQLYSTSNITFSNTGGSLALKDFYNHTIDILLYGEINQTCEGWNGTPIQGTNNGEYLKRQINGTKPIDTNTFEDWKNLRRYGIGQSCFSLQTYYCNASITTFISPDCSYEVIKRYVQNATTNIAFNIYEFSNPFLCDLLIDALKRQVQVRIFLEGSPIGGISEEEQIILNRLHTYGADIRFIIQNVTNDIYARYPFDHAKYLVIDDHIVIVESCNWVNTGIPTDTSYGNREWGIVVDNCTIAQYVLSVFQDDWDPQRCDSVSFQEMKFDMPISSSVTQRNIYHGNYIPQFQSITHDGYCNITPVFSPDTSLEAILQMIDSARETIFIEQLYIYRDWNDQRSPLVEKLVEKAQQGIDIWILMNYNPAYGPSNNNCNETKEYLELYGVNVRYLYSNWSIFTNLHNKGMIIDNTSVLISSINWNENSLMNNREAGIIIECEPIASYYAEVFFFDWNLHENSFERISETNTSNGGKNTIYIITVFTMTFAVIARDWRKRKWT